MSALHDPYAGLPQGEFVIPGQKDIVRQALMYDFDSIIDIGAGNLCATNLFIENGRQTVATVNDPAHYNMTAVPDNLKLIADINIEDYADPTMMGKFDAVWLAHVLEHTLNPGMALRTVHDLLKEDGWLFISVPPFKHQVVGGHVSVGWNLGILMYVLILTGFNVREGSFIWHGYNVSAFVQKTARPENYHLISGIGDIEKIAHLFPAAVGARQGFEGNLKSVNWNWRVIPELTAPPEDFIPKYV